jgi:hypothetical protein
MTWWDHDTGSIWSQPLGEAIAGPRKGERLDPLPVWLGDWANWRDAHPDTLALDVPGSGNSRFRLTDMAIVLELGDEAIAWFVPPLQLHGVVNDVVDGLAVAAVTDPAEPDRWAVFSRVLDDGVVVELAVRDGTLVDVGSGTTFDPVRGVALAGPLVGQNLDLLPGFTSFPEDFFTFWPNGRLWTGP